MQEDYARLRANPDAWRDYQEEIAAWDSLIGDGLADEPPYLSPEEEQAIRERSASRTRGG